MEHLTVIRSRPATPISAFFFLMAIAGLVFLMTHPVSVDGDTFTADAGLTFPLVIQALLLLVGCLSAAYLLETTIDLSSGTVITKSVFGTNGASGWSVRTESASVKDLTAVGINFVFRGPARVYLEGRIGRTHIATFLMRDSAALKLGTELAGLLRLPLREMKNDGTVKRSLT